MSLNNWTKRYIDAKIKEFNKNKFNVLHLLSWTFTLQTLQS